MTLIQEALYIKLVIHMAIGRQPNFIWLVYVNPNIKPNPKPSNCFCQHEMR